MIYRTSSFIEHYLLESEKWQTSKDKSFNEAILRESCAISETTAAAGTTSPAADTHSGFLPFGRRWWPWVWAGRATEGRTRTRSSGCCDRLACAPEGSVKTCECYQTSCCWEEKKHACVQRFLTLPTRHHRSVCLYGLSACAECGSQPTLDCSTVP